MLRRIQTTLERYGYRISKQKSRDGLYDFLTGAINEYQLGGAVQTLNVGSGGEIAQVIQAAGACPTSIDIDPDRKPDIVGSVEDLSQFSEGTFDGIFCMEVLEHVQDPFSAAREMTRVLRPNAVLIGSTPFILGMHDQPYDYWRFTAHGIRRMFSDLEVVQLTPRNEVFAASDVLVWRIFAVGKPHQKATLAWRLPLLVLSSAIRKLAGWRIANDDATTGYVFVLRKPAPVSNVHEPN